MMIPKSTMDMVESENDARTDALSSDIERLEKENHELRKIIEGSKCNASPMGIKEMVENMVKYHNEMAHNLEVFSRLLPNTVGIEEGKALTEILIKAQR